MRTVHEMRRDRHNHYAVPMVRGIGACTYGVEARGAALMAIAAPALMGGVWALPAPDKVTELTA